MVDDRRRGGEGGICPHDLHHALSWQNMKVIVKQTQPKGRVRPVGHEDLAKVVDGRIVEGIGTGDSVVQEGVVDLPRVGEDGSSSLGTPQRQSNDEADQKRMEERMHLLFLDPPKNTQPAKTTPAWSSPSLLPS